MDISKFFLIILFALTLIACDCELRRAGIVQDAATGERINNATVELGDLRAITDRNGYFMLENESGSCPTGSLSVTKEGYKPFLLEITQKGDYVSYKVQDRTEYVVFDEPRYMDSDSSDYRLGKWTRLNSVKFTAIHSDSLVIHLEQAGDKNEKK